MGRFPAGGVPHDPTADPRRRRGIRAALASTALTSTASGSAAALPAAAAPAANIDARVAAILKATPLIDGHNDWAETLRGNEGAGRWTLDLTGGLDRHTPKYDTDIARLRRGRVGGQFWSVYVDAALPPLTQVEQTLEQIDLVKDIVARYPNDFALARTAADVRRIHAAGRIASLIGVEGGGQIDANLSVLRAYHDLGAGYLTLTHVKTLDWANSATDDPKHHGLTPFGRAVVAELNRLGMLVDLSHVSEETMRAAIAASKAPVIFSHSSARALDDHPRNVSDDVLRLVAANGGVVMVNFAENYISNDYRRWSNDRGAERARLNNPPYGGEFIGAPDKAAAAMAAWETAHPAPKVTLAMVADHIDHIAHVAGPDHVGIGSDFDGVGGALPEGLGGVDTYPALLAELARRGWSDPDLAKVAGNNVLRVMARGRARRGVDGHDPGDRDAGDRRREMTVAANTPVLVGVGQAVDFWDGTGPAPSPLSLAVRAATAALADSGAPGALAAAIDSVFFVRTMADSVPGTPQPFGRCANLPGTLAARLGIAPATAVYSVVGGDQPQALVGEACAMVHAGTARAVLIAGAEATAAFKLAARQGISLDWSDSVDTALDDRGLGAPLLSGYELTNGLGAPVTTYPAFEHALRARLGLTRAEHLALMSELWAGFSRVAAANPYAQFPVARTAAFLATPSAENYPVADPYLKWHVAQDAVNQGAAVIVTTAGEAARAGIDAGRLVYLHGEARAADRLVTERADLSRSPAIAGVLARALAAAGRTAAEIAHFDLYSCFPCAVLLAAEALGLDWRTTPATVTGGLPFFGGAGNNYSLHAVATMVDRLRAHRHDFGLVLANGGFLSKEAAGVYSAQPARVDARFERGAAGRDRRRARAAARVRKRATRRSKPSPSSPPKAWRRAAMSSPARPRGRILARVRERRRARRARRRRSGRARGPYRRRRRDERRHRARLNRRQAARAFIVTGAILVKLATSANTIAASGAPVAAAKAASSAKSSVVIAT